MKKFTAKTIQELVKFYWITNSDIMKVVSKQTYYNMINWVYKTTYETKKALCQLFEVDIVTFDKLLKNTLKSKK